jgi:anti-sigma regulatory factor (Ser/Thr protein kinase)
VRWVEAFPPDLASVPKARHEAVAMLHQAGVGVDLLNAAEIVVCELASNAVRHARTACTVTVIVGDGVLRVEVFDGDSRPPALMGVDDASTSGRGLHLVAGFSTDWGWRTAEDDDGMPGKVVWAEIAVAGGN